MSIGINNPSTSASATVDTSNLVPYVGATSGVDLGANYLTCNAASIGTDLNIGGDIVIKAGQKLILDGI